jgi:6-phosphogluconolactonase
VSGVPRFLVGGYTATSGGHATGISVVEGPLDALVARTVAVVADPSFLAVAGDRVYAVSETSDGSVHAFHRDGTSLDHAWTTASGGDAPCHVRVGGDALVVANYVSGTVGVIAASTDEHAQHAPAVAALPAVHGPVADRQDGPHAHQSIAGPDGAVLVSDLGGDALHEFRLLTTADGGRGIEAVRVHRLPAGTGPRHMAWWGTDLLVSGELDGRVHRLRRDDDGVLHVVESARATDGPAGEALLSHIEVDDAGLVHVAVRGRDTIVVLDAADGLRRLAEVPSGGAWPRHFARVDGYLLVANERSDTVSVLPLDAAGVPGAPVAQVSVGTPTCVVPIA